MVHWVNKPPFKKTSCNHLRKRSFYIRIVIVYTNIGGVLMADINITLTEEELFLLEMGLDEVLWRIADTNNPTYKRFKLLEDKIFSTRWNLKKYCEDIHIDAVTERIIEDLDFSIRTYNTLKRAGINTVGDLLKLTDMQLRNIKGLSKTSVIEIDNKLDELDCKKNNEV